MNRTNIKPAITWRIPSGAIKIPLPGSYQSKTWSCGIVLKTILRYYGAANLSESQMIKELKMKKAGTDPFQFKMVIEKYGLKYLEYHNMTRQMLKYFLDKGKPVIVTVQAWGFLVSYQDVWNEGHWIIAIGYDSEGFYFEDPSHKDIRGFITYDEFETRWHDTGDNDLPEDHYGLVIWGDKVMNRNYKEKRAALIL